MPKASLKPEDEAAALEDGRTYRTTWVAGVAGGSGVGEGGWRRRGRLPPRVGGKSGGCGGRPVVFLPAAPAVRDSGAAPHAPRGGP